MKNIKFLKKGDYRIGGGGKLLNGSKIQKPKRRLIHVDI